MNSQLLKILVYLVLVLLSLNAMSCAKNTELPKNLNNDKVVARNIIGGVSATAQFQKKNGLVLLAIHSENGDGAICTGTLISKRLVLTAAHCVDESVSKINMVILHFTESLEAANDTTFRMAAEWRLHELFLSSSANNAPSWHDIALIKLDQDAPANMSFARLAPSIQLPLGAGVLQAGYGVTVGATVGVTAGATTISARAPLDTDTKLRTINGIKLIGMSTDWNELIFKQGTKGACDGDSGGPAFIKSADGQLTQVGVASRVTPGCIDISRYANVAEYSVWIQKNSMLLMAEDL